MICHDDHNHFFLSKNLIKVSLVSLLFPVSKDLTFKNWWKSLEKAYSRSLEPNVISLSSHGFLQGQISFLAVWKNARKYVSFLLYFEFCTSISKSLSTDVQKEYAVYIELSQVFVHKSLVTTHGKSRATILKFSV